MIIYIVSDGKRGHLSQTQGLAKALLERAREQKPEQEHAYYMVDITDKSWFGKFFYKGKELDYPKPDLVLCAGHSTHFAALSLARHKKCLCMVCMKPSLPFSSFDLCIIPRHDLPAGENTKGHVFQTIGAINAIRPVEGVDKKETLILVGGPSKEFIWDSEFVLTQLTTVARRTTTPMVLTTSRRTPQDFAADVSNACPSMKVEPVETTGPTWVADHLATAKEVWVTQDSVSMVYEALSSGAPVGILELPRKNRDTQKCSRVVRGLNMLIEDGSVCTFTEWAKEGVLPHSKTILNEAGRAADYILQKFPKLLS